jgi:hypothetical protein
VAPIRDLGAKRIEMSVKTTEAAYLKADEVFREARRALEETREKLVATAKNKIDVALKESYDHVGRLRQQYLEAEKAWKTAKVVAAQSKPSEHGPVGTRMVEWTNGRSYFGSTRREWSTTGRKGVLDIWTDESVAPGGTKWSLPGVGDYYVRVLKKDGTESTRFEKLNNWGLKWRPEGVVYRGE